MHPWEYPASLRRTLMSYSWTGLGADSNEGYRATEGVFWQGVWNPSDAREMVVACTGVKGLRLKDDEN